MTAKSNLTRRAATVAAGLAVLTTGLAAAPAEATPPKPPKMRVVKLPLGGKVTMWDHDHDGRYDMFVFYLNADSTPDAAVIDRDYDGDFDRRWVDRDGNGEPSTGEFSNIARKRGARGKCRQARQAARKWCVRRPHLILGLNRLPQLHPPGAVQPPAQPQPQPQPQPPAQQPAPQDPRTPLSFSADISGDGRDEVFVGDDNLRPHQSQFHRGAQQDEVVIGTNGGSSIKVKGNVDNDPKDDEIVIEDPNLDPNESRGVDIDGDGDMDVIVIGTKGGAKVSETASTDNDPNDIEILVEDPDRSSNETLPIDLDGDGDADVVIYGTR